MLTLQSHVRRSPAPLAAPMDSDLVLMDADNGNYYFLDAIGRDLWDHLAGPVEIEQLCRTLDSRYDAPADVIRRDVIDLLTTMQAKGLIEVTDPAATGTP